MENYSFIIENSDDFDKRVDSYLSEEMDGFSRNSIQKLIDSGNVTINREVKNSSYRLKKYDVVCVAIPDPIGLNIAPENIPLNILYEDADVIVINKQQGMVVHPAAGHYSGTLVNALMYHCGDNLSSINGILRPGIVHRIDKDTSGVIVTAKNDNSHHSLTMQLSGHKVMRKYSAIVLNDVKQDEGTVDKPISRHPVDRKKMAVNEKSGKRAVTHFKVLEHFAKQGKKYSLIEARLETGRTHQIRVHMANIGHPLLGDLVYGRQENPFKLSGQALHARLLGFIHPTIGEYIEFEAELPDYFKNLISKLR